MKHQQREKLAISFWLVLVLFVYFIPPKNNLIITIGFSLFLAVLLPTTTLIFKNWQQSLVFSGGIILFFLLQFFSLLTLPMILTTTALIALSLFYFSLQT